MIRLIARMTDSLTDWQTPTLQDQRSQQSVSHAFDRPKTLQRVYTVGDNDKCVGNAYVKIANICSDHRSSSRIENAVGSYRSMAPWVCNTLIEKRLKTSEWLIVVIGGVAANRLISTRCRQLLHRMHGNLLERGLEARALVRACRWQHQPSRRSSSLFVGVGIRAADPRTTRKILTGRQDDDRLSIVHRPSSVHGRLSGNDPTWPNRGHCRHIVVIDAMLGGCWRCCVLFPHRVISGSTARLITTIRQPDRPLLISSSMRAPPFPGTIWSRRMYGIASRELVATINRRNRRWAQDAANRCQHLLPQPNPVG